MKKRIISLLLCVIMVCSLLPLNVLALPSNVMVLNCNGGTLYGEETFTYSAPAYKSSSLEITSTIPVFDGYYFKGWNTEQDGSGTDYSAGDTYYFSSSNTHITLYAQWISIWSSCADTAWFYANTSADSYTISTAEELAGVSKLVASGRTFYNQTLTLDADISLDGKAWVPIGLKTDNDTKFRGTFDGADHTVSGLYIDAKTSEYQALFGYADEATIKNLRVSGEVSGKKIVAGIVGYAYDSIIENCVNDCTVNGQNFIGGVVGFAIQSLITDCCNLAEISADTSAQGNFYSGGIVGYTAGYILNCYNIGDVSGTNMVGGIVGQADEAEVSDLPVTNSDLLEKCGANIYNCYNIGSVTGENNVSGICGLLYGLVSKCYNLGITEAGKAEVAGIAYTTESSSEKVTDCYYLADCNASGNIFANKAGTALSSEKFRNQASFSGFDFNNTWEMGTFAPVLKSFNNKGSDDNPHPIANLEMLKFMRDLANSDNKLFFDNSMVLLRDIDLGCDENNQWEPIGNSYNAFCANFDGKGHIITGLYINKPTEDYVGFIGNVSSFTIKNLGVYGTVIGKDYVGGIAGFAFSQFDNCFNACNVTGNSYVAGIAGSGSFSNFFNCYNIGSITCSDNTCGGITTDPYYTKAYYCYNIGAIDCAGDDVYPVVDLFKYGNDIKDCYYLSGCNAAGTVFGTGDGVAALSETDFSDKTKFIGWDFDKTWDLSDSTVKRPLLKNAAEKGSKLNPFKVVYTDDNGGAAIHEFHYATYNEPTPACTTNTSDMISWRFVNWDKAIAAKVSGDVTYTAKVAMKAANTVRYHGNGGTCISYGQPSETFDKYFNSATCEVKPSNEFTRAGFKLIGWNTKADGTGTTYQVGDTFEFEYPHNGDTYHFYAIWQDTEKPVFVGLENGKTYCKSVKFKVTDNDGIAGVKVGNTTLTADADGYYTINNSNESDFNSVDYTVTATDLYGNITTVLVTINYHHIMSLWASDKEHFWHCCYYCGTPDSTKYPLPQVDIIGDDTVCKNENYKFTVTFPSEWCFEYANFSYQLQSDGTYLCVASNNGGRDTVDLNFAIAYNPDDGRAYVISIIKPVTVVDHTGGTANCKDKAVCTECGKPYGETDPQNHKDDLEHFEAKPATAENDGNIEYWYCPACDKYFSDNGGNTEISYAETVIPQKTSSPATGDSSNILLWLAVLFVSGGCLTGVVCYKKKKSV